MSDLQDRLTKQFRRIGADLEVEEITEPFHTFGVRGQPGFRIDVRTHDKREVFVIEARPGVRSIQVVDVQPADRHLLLHVETTGRRDRDGIGRFIDNANKFLCGHDERHLFVAGVPTQARNVVHAKDLLMPPEIRERAQNFPVKERHKRHNEVYKRQGEWFFVLADIHFSPNPKDIKHDEPLRRGRSKPHIAAQLVNYGGEPVMVNGKYPNGLTLPDFNALPKKEREARGWRKMLRNGSVYARGHIRHPDHKTLLLRQWHKVIMSAEVMLEQVAFLD